MMTSGPSEVWRVRESAVEPMAGVIIALVVDGAVQGLDDGSLETTYLESLMTECEQGVDGSEFAASFVRLTLIRRLLMSALAPRASSLSSRASARILHRSLNPNR